MSQAGVESRLTIDEIGVDADGRQIATLVASSGATLTVPLALLPAGAKVNQIVVASFVLDPEASQDRARRVGNLQHRLFNRDAPS